MSTPAQPNVPDLTSVSKVAGACIANISTAERRKRLTFGVALFAISLVALALLVATGVDRLWRLPLAFLFMGAASGYFQWQDKTCIGLANANSRKLGEHAETIEDSTELAQVKAQARRVQTKVLFASIVMTLLALTLPVMA